MTDAPSGERSLARSSAVMAAGTVVSRLLGFARASMLGGRRRHRPGRRHLPGRQHAAQPVLPAARRRRPQRRPGPADHQGGQPRRRRPRVRQPAAHPVAGPARSAPPSSSPLPRPCSSGCSPTAWDADDPRARHGVRLHLPAPGLLLRALHAVRPGAQRPRPVRGIHVGTRRWPTSSPSAGCSWFRCGLRQGHPGRGLDARRWSGCSRARRPWGSPPRPLALWFPLRRSGFRYRPVWGFRGRGAAVGAPRSPLWTFAAVAVSQLGFIVTSKVMTRAGDLLDERGQVGAGVTAYGLAFLLFMLPHSLITVSLVTALFTRLSQAAHRGDTPRGGRRPRPRPPDAGGAARARHRRRARPRGPGRPGRLPRQQPRREPRDRRT